MRGTFAVIVTLASLLAGCQSIGLRPAPGAQTLPDESDAAVAEGHGVRLITDADEWSGKPQSLDRHMIALQTTIENNSDRLLRLSYADISLSSNGDFTYHPLPPLDIRGPIVERADLPLYTARFYQDGFYPSPSFYPRYVGLKPWTYAWSWRQLDPFYYERYYRGWAVPLPTDDMVEMGLPEGVIEPGGRIRGFLYFPSLDPQADRAMLTMQLIEAETGEPFGAIEIPFVVGAGT